MDGHVPVTHERRHLDGEAALAALLLHVGLRPVELVEERREDGAVAGDDVDEGVAFGRRVEGEANQEQSEAIRSNQKQSGAIKSNLSQSPPSGVASRGKPCCT